MRRLLPWMHLLRRDRTERPEDGRTEPADAIVEEPIATTDKPKPATDFELAKYNTDRTHELELNKFTHALEVERLKILQLLNGGAFTVALAFSDLVLEAAGPARDLALISVATWVAGLLAAAWATQLQLDSQRAFTQAYHNRRRTMEWRALAVLHPDDPGTVSALSAPAPTRQPEGANIPSFEAMDPRRKFAALADHYRTKGEDIQPNVKTWALGSLRLFALGAALMIAAVALAAPANGPEAAAPFVFG